MPNIYITQEERRMVNDNRPGARKPTSQRREWAVLIAALAGSAIAGLLIVYILTTGLEYLMDALS